MARKSLPRGSNGFFLILIFIIFENIIKISVITSERFASNAVIKIIACQRKRSHFFQLTNHRQKQGGTGTGFRRGDFETPAIFDPESLETWTRPSPGIFLRYNPDSARAGMGEHVPELGIVKNFKVIFLESFPQ